MIRDKAFNCAGLMVEGSFGGFAAKLAAAWFVADSNNQFTIEQAFPDLWAKAEAQIDAEHAQWEAENNEA
jgi:hypothetical protein